MSGSTPLKDRSVILKTVRPEGSFICTAVPVSSTLLLTAAHCVSGNVLSISIYNWKIKDFEIHPQYSHDRSYAQFDVARIRLRFPLINSSYAEISSVQSQGEFLRVGFGMRNGYNRKNILDQKIKFYSESDEIISFFESNSVSGDSGGPIYQFQGGEWRLVAIHSTFSFGPQGTFSLNPTLEQIREWALVP